MDEASYRPRTARDALIAEMLGDVGRLHQSVLELSDQLPTHTKVSVDLIQLQTDKSIEQLTEALGRVIQATDTFKPQFYAYINQEATTARNEILRTGIDVQKKVIEVMSERILNIERATSIAKEEISEAAAVQLVNANKLLGDAVKASLSDFIKEHAPRPLRLGLIHVTACLFVAVLLTAVTFSAVRHLDDTKQQRAMDIGVAVQAAWNQLDDKARTIILSRINQRREGNG